MSDVIYKKGLPSMVDKELKREKSDKRTKRSEKYSPKVIITFIVVIIILAIVMTLNHDLFGWLNPLFGRE